MDVFLYHKFDYVSKMQINNGIKMRHEYCN